MEYLQAVRAAAVVLTWMALGWALRLSADAYLVLGVPIIIVYQRSVLRRPLGALWRFDGAPLAWGGVGVTVSAAAAALPTLQLASIAARGVTREDAPTAAWLVCAIVGAFGLGWSAATWRRARFQIDAQQAQLAAAIAAIGIAIFTANGLLSGQHLEHDAGAAARTFLQDLLLYVDVGFVLEEVVFRGAFDPVIGQGRIAGADGIASAAFVSLLWGVWHLPLFVRGLGDVPAALHVVALHLGLGIPLSILARRAGTLGPSVIVHALIDAWRNQWLPS